jgi:hypothetical protein
MWSLRSAADRLVGVGKRIVEAWRELRRREPPENDSSFDSELAHMREVRHGADERRRRTPR